MNNAIAPQNQTFWYLKRPNTLPLQKNKDADVVVIGGGMAGLTTAQAFAQKGKKVILLEAYYCGAGASGKSSGFIEPNCEISLSEFIERYGLEGGNTIWELIQKNGVEHIRKNIHDHHLDCDYTEQDSLDVASTKNDVAAIMQEAEYLSQFGHPSQFIKKDDIPLYVGSNAYFGGVVYPNSFGISAYKYCQGIKDILLNKGVEIYEETPVINIKDHTVTTLHATVKADYIIVCTDRFTSNLKKLINTIYHVQNFVLASQVLSPKTIKELFPNKPVMVCDTELIYNFYRMTENRLLMGGGSVVKLYDKTESYHSPYMYKKLTESIKNTFPNIDLQFEQMWPGLIGVSKDIAPLTGFDKNSPSIYYIAAATGLPIAAMLGNYCADHIIDGKDTLKDYFSPYRNFAVDGITQTILGTKATFALSHWLTQKDIKHI
jgi:gamma-glutamylputrescine oxidase